MKKTVSELWEEIFKDFSILDKIKENKWFKITADQIRNYKGTYSR